MDKNTVTRLIHETFLVPVVVIDDAARIPDTARALAAGNIPVMEITLRTEAAFPAISLAAEKHPEVVTGAGTVLNIESCREAVSRGASFIVSPGYDGEIVEYCQKNSVAVFPGCVTPTEITAALKAGIDTVKFFPANVYGGIKAIKALAAPFPMMRFIPTGGVSAENIADFFQDEIFAVGGGWLCDRKMVNAGNFSAITETCLASVELVKKYRARNS